MIGWLDFFGKLIEHVAKKLLDKTIHPASPSRKAACQAFVRLFDSIVTIEYLTKDFLCVMKKDIEMADSIERHLQVLKEARQALARFIRTEFSIEDLLFVTKKY